MYRPGKLLVVRGHPVLDMLAGPRYPIVKCRLVRVHLLFTLKHLHFPDRWCVKLCYALLSFCPTNSRHWIHLLCENGSLVAFFHLHLFGVEFVP